MMTNENGAEATIPSRAGKSEHRRLMLGRWWSPGDVLIVLAVVALSVFLIAQSVIGAGGDNNLMIRVTANGEEVLVRPLREDHEELTVRGFEGESYLEIEGGRVRMIDSACPDKLCVKSGWISRQGESIVCLPNRVVIEITGGEGGPDVVNQ